jgi:cell division protein FtsW (lipid II flippase)
MFDRCNAASIAANIPMHFWQRWGWHILFFAFVLLVLVLNSHMGRVLMVVRAGLVLAP